MHLRLALHEIKALSLLGNKVSLDIHAADGTKVYFFNVGNQVDS